MEEMSKTELIELIKSQEITINGLTKIVNSMQKEREGLVSDLFDIKMKSLANK